MIVGRAGRNQVLGFACAHALVFACVHVLLCNSNEQYFSCSFGDRAY